MPTDIRTDELVREVLKQNPQLTYVDLSDCHHCTSGILQVLTIKNSYVKNLVLEDCHWVSREALEYHAFHQVPAPLG